MCLLCLGNTCNFLDSKHGVFVSVCLVLLIFFFLYVFTLFVLFLRIRAQAPTIAPSQYPTAAPTGAPLYVPLCIEQPCDCENEDEFCQFCQGNNICGQCQDGYFRLNDNTPCSNCQEIFGSSCLFCQDNNGCGQCDTTYTHRVYDEQEDLWYCKPNTPNPTSQPTFKPTNNPTVTHDGGASGDNICPDPLDTIDHCSEDDKCSNCQSWGGCTQCNNGYWTFDFKHRCQECTNIPNCVSCNAWVGCSQCQPGYQQVWTTQCPKSDGSQAVVSTCEPLI